MTAAEVITEALRRDPSLTAADLEALAQVKRQRVNQILRKHGLRAAPAHPRDKDEQLVVRVTAREKVSYRHASRKAGVDMSEWVRSRLSEAAEKEISSSA